MRARSRSIALLLGAQCAFAFTETGFAQFKTWVGPAGTGNWGAALNWSPVGVPGAADIALLTQSDANNRTVSYTSSSIGNDAAQLVLNASGTGQMTLLQSAGDFAVPNFTLASSGSGVFNQQLGTAAIGTLNIANNASGNGTLAMGEAVMVVSNLLAVGANGTGTLILNDGTLTAISTLSVGHNAGAVGRLMMGSGSFDAVLSAGTLLIGNSGTGTASIAGGTVSCSTLRLGVGSGGAGTLINSGRMVVGNVEVGVNGTGHWQPTSANVECSGNVTLGSGVFGSGAINQSNSGTISVAGSMYVGGLSVTGGVGAVTQNSSIHIGNELRITDGKYSMNEGADLSASFVTVNGGEFASNFDASLNDMDAMHVASFTQNGGRVTGRLLLTTATNPPPIFKTFVYNGGTFDAAMHVATNTGTFLYTAPLTIGGGLHASGTFAFPAGPALIIHGEGLNLSFAPACTIAGNVTADSVFLEAVTCTHTGTLRVDGDFTLKGDSTFFVDGMYTINSGTLTMASAPATAVATFGGSASEAAHFVANGGSTVLQNVFLHSSSDASVAGAARVSVLGSASLNGTFTLSSASASVTVGELLTRSRPALISAGTLTCLGDLTVANIGSGTVTQTGGIVSVGGSLRIDPTNSVLAATYSQSGGVLTVTGNILNNDLLSLNGGSASGGNLDGAGRLSISTIGALTVNRVRQDQVDMSGTPAPRLTIRPAGTDQATSRVGTLALSGNAQFDLADNDLIVTATAESSLKQMIITARNGGAWDGNGLTGSAARNHPQRATTLGVLDALSYFSVYGANAPFNGLPVSASDLIVKYTYYGDSDFNGVVNFDDYARIDAGFNSGGSTWLQGDFNYDQVINFDDYALIDLAFNTQSGTLVRAMDWLEGEDRSMRGMDTPELRMIIDHFAQFGVPYAQSFLSAVPEPTSAMVFAGVVAAATVRRRRGHSSQA